MALSTEEKAVNILANDVKGSTALKLDFEAFKMAFHGSVTTLNAIEGNTGDVVSVEGAYNEYEHLVLENPSSGYENAFNHSSKL